MPKYPILTDGRLVEVDVEDEQEQRMVRGYWGRGVQSFLTHGRTDRLGDFRGQRVGGFPLETDPDVISDWAERNPEFDPGELYES